MPFLSRGQALKILPATHQVLAKLFIMIVLNNKTLMKLSYHSNTTGTEPLFYLLNLSPLSTPTHVKPGRNLQITPIWISIISIISISIQ